jgi:dTDP-4-amino-4,6-dideoxygalactose transaminase
VQLKRLPEIIAARRRIAARYAAVLAAVPGVRVPHEPARARSNWQSYCVALADGIDQRAVMQRLLDEGISTRRGVMCIHREASYGGESDAALANSERCQDHGIILPLHHQLTHDDVRRVGHVLAMACDSAAKQSSGKG